MTTLGHAIALAASAHADQRERSGWPYVLHALRVMAAVEGETAAVVAVLHDVAEDCPDWPLERIAAKGYGPEVMEPLRLLTRPTGVSYADYIDAIAASRDPIARAVKIADLEDHLHPDRAATLTPAQERRYRPALERLTALSPSPSGARP